MSKRASEHSREAKRAKAKLMYSTRCYHSRRGYRSLHS